MAGSGKTKRFSEEHEWVDVVDDVATIGITEYAAKELGDITFIELPEVGTAFNAGDVMAVVESVKAASDMFCPVAGKVLEVNTVLEESPDQINESAEDAGWICRLKDINVEDLDALMTDTEYDEFIAS